MHKLTLNVTAIAATVALGLGVAAASPPSGQLTFQDYGRAQVATAGQVTNPAGTSAYLGSYTIAPDASTGWKSLPGSALVAVTGGALTVHSAPAAGSNDAACKAQTVDAGQAVVLPSGATALHNMGSAPAVVLVAALGLPAPGADPFASGADADAAGCPPLAASGASDLAAKALGSGTFVDPGTYQGHGMHVSDVKPVEGGKDVLFSSYDLQPGASSGWINHRDQLGVMTKGTLTYYEAHDGQCQKTDSYGAGSAFYHGPHTHMAVNEGSEPLTVVIAHFNVPHNEHPAPVVGNQGDAFDFSPLPPADCPRLR